MSIHIHFQPLDLEIVQKRINPFLLGEGDLDDIAAKALRPDTSARTFFSKCTQKPLDAVKKSGAALPDWYDEEMNRWYQPWFVARADPAAVVQIIEGYEEAGPKELQDIVRDQVKTLQALKVVEQVKPVHAPARS